jgi:peptide/nickel transport system substrate-binding protein
MASIARRIGLQWRAAQRGLVAVCCALAACASEHAARDRDDALVVLLPRDALEVDPRFTVDAYGLKVSRLLFASLVRIDPNTLQVVPDLAREIALVDDQTYRVELKPGLRFSDGSALDAEDVAATFRSIVDPALGSRYAQTYKRIERIEVQGAQRIVFHLNGPHATFMTDLEMPILRAEDARRHLGEPAAARVVGAGPYVMRERAPGRIELVANPRWHDGTARHPVVRLLVIHDDNTRALRMLAGAGDLALNSVPPLLLPLFERDTRFVVRAAPGVSTTYVGLNTDAPALRDVRVRRAIAHAIDRAALIRAKFGGRARLANGWVAPGHWAYSDRVAHYDHDPAAARALLAQARSTSHGAPLVLTLRCGSDRFRLSIARAIAAMLAEVGIEVDVRPSEVATLIADLNRGRFELTMLEVPELIEPHILSWFFGSDHVPGGGREGANRWRLRSAALDAALERGRANSDPGVRRAAYEDAQRILSEELPVISLWHEDTVAVEDVRARDVPAPRLARFDILAR